MCGVEAELIVCDDEKEKELMAVMQERRRFLEPFVIDMECSLLQSIMATVEVSELLDTTNTEAINTFTNLL